MWRHATTSQHLSLASDDVYGPNFWILYWHNQQLVPMASGSCQRLPINSIVLIFNSIQDLHVMHYQLLVGPVQYGIYCVWNFPFCNNVNFGNFHFQHSTTIQEHMLQL